MLPTLGQWMDDKLRCDRRMAKPPTFALVSILTLTACAGQDTSKWPSPQSLQTGLTVAEAVWTTYCSTQKTAGICTQNAAKVSAAEQAAQDALNAYAEAYASGNVTQAVLDNLNKAIADVAALIAAIENKGP